MTLFYTDLKKPIFFNVLLNTCLTICYCWFNEWNCFRSLNQAQLWHEVKILLKTDRMTLSQVEIKPRFGDWQSPTTAVKITLYRIHKVSWIFSMTTAKWTAQQRRSKASCVTNLFACFTGFCDLFLRPPQAAKAFQMHSEKSQEGIASEIAFHIHLKFCVTLMV